MRTNSPTASDLSHNSMVIVVLDDTIRREAARLIQLVTISTCQWDETIANSRKAILPN